MDNLSLIEVYRSKIRLIPLNIATSTKKSISLIEGLLSFFEVNIHVKSLKVKGRQFFFHLAGFLVIAVSLTEVLLY